MAEESAGSSYLAALKRSASLQGTDAASAPAQGTDRAGPNSGAAAKQGASAGLAHPERRRSPRYKCEGSTEIRREGSDVRTWARCTDISVNGCYLETAATYPTDILLQLQIEVNQIRIHVRGHVRVTYPQVGIGIEFASMAEEDRTRLKEMLRTLARPSVIMGVPSSASGSTDHPMPHISDPGAALSALVKFFAERQMLTRSEFILLLRRSQEAGAGGRQ